MSKVKKTAAEPEKEKGFTLIEMSVVMVIVGIVVSVMMTVMPSVIRTGKLKEARANLDKYDNVLKGYAIVNLRLPFADSNGDGIENAGVTTGTLPFMTLGLSSGNDVWGNPIKYAVYGILAGTPAPADKAALLLIIAGLPAPSGATFNPGTVYTTTAGICPGPSPANQAYVIASGGPRDLDGANGMFDLCNGTAGTGFNAENTIQSPTYDDIVRALSITEFSALTCSP
jgi:prepilin-type N-terminal cleavage/methylation domain-containing protein